VIFFSRELESKEKMFFKLLTTGWKILFPPKEIAALFWVAVAAAVARTRSVHGVKMASSPQ
jgi:hypothetical protein